MKSAKNTIMQSWDRRIKNKNLGRQRGKGSFIADFLIGGLTSIVDNTMTAPINRVKLLL